MSELCELVRMLQQVTATASDGVESGVELRLLAPPHSICSSLGTHGACSTMHCNDRPVAACAVAARSAVSADSVDQRTRAATGRRAKELSRNAVRLCPVRDW